MFTGEDFPSTNSKTPAGHTSTQVPQPVHLSTSTFTSTKLITFKIFNELTFSEIKALWKKRDTDQS